MKFTESCLYRFVTLINSDGLVQNLVHNAHSLHYIRVLETFVGWIPHATSKKELVQKKNKFLACAKRAAEIIPL